MDKMALWVEKYRPQVLEDLVLEEATREILTKCISKDEVPHLLLSGNVGCGKTTIAKILLNKIDCDFVLMNASDERGIDTVRDKIKRFAMVSSFKKWKIVFLDEFDAMTPDAQFALRNLMETYSGHTRFILTCNYLNKIIEPIRSRCQLIEFQNLNRKSIVKLLAKILETEKIEYAQDDLFVLVDTYYPDIRSMINNLQLYSNAGKWTIKGTESFRGYEQLVELLKKKDLKSIRELNISTTEAYKYLFDKVDELSEDWGTKVELSLIISEALYREVFAPDKSINFASAMLQIIGKL